MSHQVVSWKSTKYTRFAEGLSCVKCGKPDAVGCHYTGIRQLLLGKGTGIKCSDLAIADLCDTCHREFDGYKVSWHELSVIEDNVSTHDFRYLTQIFQSEEFMYWVLVTISRRLELGYVLEFGEEFKIDY